ncbi:MAG: DUF368 domain-containing protein [Chloroflexi bacterium]|nr:DUF368 domain-containing protein [Chloroflexota bacterium]|tara:strand:- start:56930 stop:57811 length:882 start_codon:yes stop_codon:yes gene_type:complete
MVNNFKNFFSFGSLMLLIKGFAIGSANIIPGLSGGTIAFVTGIYERLLLSINLLYSRKVLSMAFRLRFKELFDAIDIKFLFLILVGTLGGIFLTAKYIELLLEKFPLLFFSFLFGLMLGAALLLGKEEKVWDRETFFHLIAGCFLGFALTIVFPEIQSESMFLVLGSGILVAGAMILPGISGSYILLITGNYERMISAINIFDLEVLSIFALGFVGGIILFARIIKRFIEQSRKKTFSLLVGVVLGSLKSLWPGYVIPDIVLGSNDILAMSILILGGFVVALGIPLVASITKK